MSSPALPASTEMNNAWKKLLSELPIPQLLKLREKTKQIQAQQLTIINDVLTEKGYVEPHLEGTDPKPSNVIVG